MKLKKLLLKTAISGFLLWFVGLYFVTPYFVSASPSASFVKSWGTYEQGYTLQPANMVTDPASGNIYALGNMQTNQFHIFDGNGNFQTHFSLTNNGCSQISVSAGASGRKYVDDACTNHIYIYDSSNNLLSQFGSTGAGNGQFYTAWAGKYSFFNNKYYALDSGGGSHPRVEIFDADGNYLSQFGSWGTGDGQFSFPAAIAISPVDGTVYVYDQRSIQAFDKDGVFIRKFGSVGTGDGQFSSQSNGVYMEVSSDGSKLYYLDRANNRVEIFSDQGVFLNKFGTQGSGNGQFQFMDGLGFSPDGTKLYVSDATNKNIQVFNTSDNSYVSTIDFTYVPPGGHMGYVEDITADTSGNIYVVDSDNNRIQVFDADGNFTRQFGSYGTGDGEMAYPTSAAISPLNGNMYVIDPGPTGTEARIEVFDTNGNYLSKFGSSGSGDGQFGYAEDIAIDASGNVYVADSDNNRVVVFDASGNFLSTWGTSGTGNGQFDYPVAIVVSPINNHVYVSDSGNNRIEVFDTNGTYLSQWGSSGAGNGQFNYAEGISVDSNGNVFVNDGGNYRIQVFDKDGNYIAQWGSRGTGDMEFDYPTSLINYGNYIYVYDDVGVVKKYSIDIVALPPVITTSDSVQKPFGSVSGTAEANATITVSENASTICTTTADGSGNWTCTLSSPITETGVHTISAVQTDVSGNISSAATKTITVTVPNRSGSIPTGGGSSTGTKMNQNPATPPVVTPVAPVTPMVDTSCDAQFTQKLRKGSFGNEVVKVQQFLASRGFFAARATGYYGTITTRAVKAFQSAYYKEILVPLHLTNATGIWSYATIGLANNLLCTQQ